MATGIEQLLDEIRTLSPHEREQLRQALDAEAGAAVSQSGEAEFQRRLLEKGLLTKVKPPVADMEPYRDRQPFEIDGKPLSESIIEERR